MILWMTFCLAAGVLLCAAATALEAALRALRLPARGVWMAALALSVAIPAGARWIPRAAEPAPLPSVVALPGMMVQTPQPSVSAALPEMPAAPRPHPATRSWPPDAALRTAWLALAALVALWWAASSALLAVRRRSWREAVVDGVPVLVSPSTGPAVAGLIRGRIVLPEWVVAEADEGARALLLRHEAEHLRAGDPRLLALGFLCAALLPWSPAAWWQLRRLRLAVEVDCDARVLARSGDVRAYGALLLDAGRRAGSGRLLPVAFSHPRSFLERRIRMMTQPALPRRRRALASLAAVALVTAGGVAMVPLPGVPAPSASVVGGDTIQPLPLNADQIALVIDSLYPPLLRGAGITGQVTVRLAVATDGSASPRGVQDVSDPRFIEPALRALQRARFRPARADGRDVPSTLLLPVRFQPRERDPGLGMRGDTLLPRQVNVQEVVRVAAVQYPPLLRDAGITGRAYVRVRVAATGASSVLGVAGTTDARFNEPALAVARHMRFQPAEVGGRAVEYTLVLPVEFAPGASSAGQTPQPADPGGALSGETRARQAAVEEGFRADVDRQLRQIRDGLRARHPRILRDGLPAAEYVYFLVDEQGRVTGSGMAPMHTRDGWFSSDLEADMRRLHPDRRVTSTFLYPGMPLAEGRGPGANVAWVTVAEQRP